MAQGDMQKLSDEIQSNLKKHPSSRLGQCVFNSLFALFPEIAEEIRDSEFDPFYKKDHSLQPSLDKISELMSIKDPQGFIPYPIRN